MNTSFQNCNIVFILKLKKMMIFTDQSEREFRTIKSKIGIKSSCFFLPSSHPS